jgi:hypothetical protein
MISLVDAIATVEAAKAVEAPISFSVPGAFRKGFGPFTLRNEFHNQCNNKAI